MVGRKTKAKRRFDQLKLIDQLIGGTDCREFCGIGDISRQEIDFQSSHFRRIT